MKSSTDQQIEIRPMTGTFGTEILGVDLSEPLSDEVFNEINQALLDYHVIFFRDQDITPRQHVDFGRRFGELHIHPFIPAHEDQPEIIVLGGKTPGPGPYARNSNVWHTDLTYSQEPPMGSILHGIEIPESGGDTMFADLTAAYDGLSDRLQHLFSDMMAVHSMSATKTRVSERESNALLSLLHDHIDQPEYQCRFRWQKNSIAFWDNRCTQHYAVADYTEIRRMHRVTVCGPRPS
jgi:taurine dioxygenase